MGKTRPRQEATTRADQKFEKKVQFYAKVRDTIASLAPQKSIRRNRRRQVKRQQRRKAYDLSSLSDFLPELKDAEFKLNCKSRQSLVLKEENRVRSVFSSPLLPANSLAAIHQHLQSTQPVNNEKPAKKHDKKNGSKKKKGRKREASTGRGAMEL